MRYLGVNVIEELSIYNGKQITRYYIKQVQANDIVEYGRLVYRPVISEKESPINVDARLNAVLNLMVGIGEGDIADGEGKVISSDPNSTNFNKDWKQFLKINDSANLQEIALEIFEKFKRIEKKIVDLADPKSEKKIPSYLMNLNKISNDG